MAFVTSGIVTPSLTSSDTAAHLAVGTMAETSDGGKAMYVVAQSAISQYDAVAIVQSSSATGASICAAPITTTNAATTSRVGFAQAAIAAGSYGWVMLSGSSIRVNCLASCQPAVPLFTTATAGWLDDTIVSAGFISGVTAMTSAASASAVQCVAAFAQIEQYG